MNEIMERVVRQHLSGNIQDIPVYILKSELNSTSLEEIWYLLSKEQQFVLKKHLPCHEHYHSLIGDQFDGSPPQRRYCYNCKNKKLYVSIKNYIQICKKNIYFDIYCICSCFPMYKM